MVKNLLAKAGDKMSRRFHLWVIPSPARRAMLGPGRVQRAKGCWDHGAKRVLQNCPALPAHVRNHFPTAPQ